MNSKMEAIFKRAFQRRAARVGVSEGCAPRTPANFANLRTSAESSTKKPPPRLRPVAKLREVGEAAPPVFAAGMRVMVHPPPDRKTGRTYEPWAGIVRTVGPGTLWVVKEHDPVPTLQGHAAYNVHPAWALPVPKDGRPT